MIASESLCARRGQVSSVYQGEDGLHPPSEERGSQEGVGAARPCRGNHVVAHPPLASHPVRPRIFNRSMQCIALAEFVDENV